MTKTQAARTLANYILNAQVAGQFDEEDELVVAAKKILA